MSARASILLTGFEPFGGDTVNPSERIARSLHGAEIDGARVHGEVLPCVFGASITRLHEALDRVRPTIALCLGQATGREGLTVERVAINVDDARMPDNAGASPIDLPIVSGGPAAHFATLPIKAIVAGLQQAGFAASVSQTAGTFVCNHVFYALMHRLGRGPARGGFLHVPALPEQVRDDRPAPTMPFEAMVEGVRLALAIALREREDLRAGGGSVA